MEKIKFIMSKLWMFLRPFICQLMSQGGAILAETAMTAVSAVALSMQEADGEAKRRQAFEIIQTELTKKGVQMATSIINAALEAAVVSLKEKTGQ